MKKQYRLVYKVFGFMTASTVACLVILLTYLDSQLPDVEVLEDIQLQTPLKIFSNDGLLMAEFGQKRRSPVPLEDIPHDLINAILATEDRRFFEHGGVDYRGLVRAAAFLVTRGHKGQGGSTITMQVARNFFLTRQKTFARKINEILLAKKIEKELSKNRILELYLNKIYFGKNAYGVGAAAEVYYGTTPDKLNLAQMAMIAGLPQAPTAINPINNPNGAMNRRSHVLSRMLHYGFISEERYQQANSAPLSAKFHARPIDLKAPYVAEMVRKSLVNQFGERVYTEGLEVYTTIDSKAQIAATKALQSGLKAYDRRHGFRGAVGHIFDGDLSKLNEYPKYFGLQPVMVDRISDDGIGVTDIEGNMLNVSSDKLWFKPSRHNLKIGDVLYFEGNEISQVPEINGAFVAVSPVDGAIIALEGGGDFNQSAFNRATQAKRQAGSAFKPFIYASALANGMTPATIINDAPVVFNDPSLEGAWRPQNHTKEFGGPTRLREGLIRSRNLVSIRLLQQIGINKTVNYLTKFGFNEQRIPGGLSLALGTAEVSPLEMSVAIAHFANGGFQISPYIIKRIVDSDGSLLFEANPPKADTFGNLDTELNERAQRVLEPDVAFIMNNMLQDVIQSGTGRRARTLGRNDLAGKTGSTNDNMDAWFTGYNQHVAASVWIGFDSARTIKEYGAKAALPIWIDFMRPYLKDKPQLSLPQPENVVAARIDPKTGLLARQEQENAIFEYFKDNAVPSAMAPDPVASYGEEEPIDNLF